MIRTKTQIIKSFQKASRNQILIKFSFIWQNERTQRLNQTLRKFEQFTSTFSLSTLKNQRKMILRNLVLKINEFY